MLKQSIGTDPCRCCDTGISFVSIRLVLPGVDVGDACVVMFVLHGHVFSDSADGGGTGWPLWWWSEIGAVAGHGSVLERVRRSFRVGLHQVVVGFDGGAALVLVLVLVFVTVG